MGDLTALDLGILALVGFGCWRGMRTGALRQVVGAVGIVLGLILGIVLMDAVGAVVVTSLGLSERLSPVLGFVVTFGVIVALAAVVAQLARKALSILKLGFVDRLAGAGVGGIRVALAISVLFLVTGPVALPGGEPLLIGEETREASALYEPVRALAPAAWSAFTFVAPGLEDPLRVTFGDRTRVEERDTPLTLLDARLQDPSDL
jgi:membrane protein required for colicin V production